MKPMIALEYLSTVMDVVAADEEVNICCGAWRFTRITVVTPLGTRLGKRNGHSVYLRWVVVERGKVQVFVLDATVG